MRYIIIIIALSCLTFFVVKNDRSLNFLQQENHNTIPQTDRELPPLNKEAMMEVVKLRKEIKQNKALSSVFEDFQEIGPNKPDAICHSGECYSGMVKNLVIDIENKNMFVLASSTGGGWVSYNRGYTWEPIDDNWAGAQLLWVTQSLENPNLFYFAASSLGLFIWDKSKDEGIQEWTGTINGTPNSTFEFVSYIKMDPSNKNIHYVSTQYEIFKYENGEYTEHIVSNFNWLADFEVVPNVGLVTSNSLTISIHKEDGTTNEFDTNFPASSRAEIAYSPSDPHIIYSFSATSGTIKMFRTLDGGMIWEELNLGSIYEGFQAHDQTMEIHRYDDDHEIIIYGGVHLNRIIIEKTHQSLPEVKAIRGIHDDHHGSIVDQDTFYIYSDGGLFKIRKEEIENPWPETTPLSSGLNTLQVWDIAFQQNTNAVALGIWHNGSWHKGQNDTFLNLNRGDGFESAYHPVDPNIVYSTSQRGSVYRTYIDEDELESISPQLNPVPFRTKIFTHPNFPEDLFFIADGIHIIPDASSCTNSICTNEEIIEVEDLKAVRFDPSGRTNTVYAFTNRSLTIVPDLSIDYGEKVLDFLNPDNPSTFGFTLVDLYVTQLENENTFYVLQIGFENEYEIRKFKTLNNMEIELDTAYNINFPQGVKPSRFIVTESTHSDFVFATNHGLFTCPKDQQIPMPETGLPNVDIIDIEYDYSQHKLFFATYGRGIWSATLNEEIISSIQESDSNYSLSIFPNPAIENLNLISPHTETLEIIDLNGQSLKTFKSIKNQKLNLEISELAQGSYFIRGRSTGEIQRFVKI